MSNQEKLSTLNYTQEEHVEDLRQALLRLTGAGFELLQADLQSVQDRLAQFREALNEAEAKIKVQGGELGDRDQELHTLLEEANGRIQGLEQTYDSLHASLQKKIDNIQQLLDEPVSVARRLSPVLIPVIEENVQNKGEEFAEAVAPIMGPAIRHQIRQAKDDIINALYPLIGQIIGKAIAESLRELTRNIDARLRQRFDPRLFFRRLSLRLRGVSEAELILRESLPFTVEHIFLIHHKTGLLLEQISRQEQADLDIIGAMLTAIRDFVRDSFREEDSNLEEITHGDQRILLEDGQFAYLAVIIDGIEPTGFNHQMNNVITQINLRYEKQLQAFDGEMERLPDFQPELKPLLAPESNLLTPEATPAGLSRNQKLFFWAGLIGILLLLGLAIFACVFTIRLWPLAFPASLMIVSPSATPRPILPGLIQPSNILTPLITTSSTSTDTPSPTLAPTRSPTPTNTPTATLQPSPKPTLTTGVLSGNLYVRLGPGVDFKSIAVIFAGETVVIKEEQEDWYLVAWPAEGQPQLEGWIWVRMVTLHNN